MCIERKATGKYVLACFLFATMNNAMQVKNWNRMQNAADLVVVVWGGGGGGGRYFINVKSIRTYATYNFTTCAFFTKCEILV